MATDITAAPTEEKVFIGVEYNKECGNVYPTPEGEEHGVYVPVGSTVTFAFIPNTNYFIENMIIDGEKLPQPVHTYTFSNVSSEEQHTISIEFNSIKENENGKLLRDEMADATKHMLQFIESTLNPDIDTHAPLSKLRYDLLDIDKMLRTLFGYVDKLSTESNLK
jgi:hypothetical protein